MEVKLVDWSLPNDNNNTGFTSIFTSIVFVENPKIHLHKMSKVNKSVCSFKVAHLTGLGFPFVQ